jgi:pimeloyl-ACP methyl ester carboxylesterase
MWIRVRVLREEADVERTIRMPDGRALAVQASGDPADRAVLVHAGTPDSRYQDGSVVADAARHGLRLISYDRPGYGGSDSLPGRTVADCAEDVRAICAALGIDRLAMWGWSGGGPHVLACAALLPDLVTAVAALASLAPYDADGLDYFAGMDQADIDDYRLLLADPAAARAKWDHDREALLATSAEDLAQGLASFMSPVDVAVLTEELTGSLTRAVHQALAPGSQGWWDDSRATLTPWGFDVASISVPVLLLHGQQDRSVPVSHGRWLAANIPAVTARILPQDGHLTLTHRIGEVHSWLAEHLDAAPSRIQVSQPSQDIPSM